MPAFFDLLREETHPAVRVVLGHFLFVYIHPYMDGNGRIGRFLMNVMLASGRIPLDGHIGWGLQRLHVCPRTAEVSVRTSFPSPNSLVALREGVSRASPCRLCRSLPDDSPRATGRSLCQDSSIIE